ncbi:ATP-binding cassette domain-containing protein [Chloroflexota bacterium]
MVCIRLNKTVLDNVALGLEIRGVPKEERYSRALEEIETVGLKGWENHLPGTLSGGMQQRVGIARALTVDPEILLMDEPFSGLDPLIRRDMQDELLDILAEMNKTIVFVTHDLDEALKLGNHIAIMRNGEIVQIGTPEEVITAPADAYVREFVQDASLAMVVSAQSIMKKPRSLIYDWQGPKAALHTLKDRDMDYAFVVTKGRKLLGQVTLDDLVEMIRKKQQSLQEGLKPDFPSVAPDMVLEQLFPIASTAKYAIPVVDETNKLLGEIHLGAIFDRLAREEEVEDKNTKDKEAKPKELGKEAKTDERIPYIYANSPTSMD